ncbi:cation:proton antiporter regulatory subunit [Candidatus Omnitrophota bacterium]
MNILLFLMTLIVSFIAVRIGAIAFELTGLEWSLAKFQALSCFTGTGFTTKEAELITGHPQRRRIASVLIVLGHAGLVTLIATFANTLRTDALMPKFRIPILHLIVPRGLLPWLNLSIIIFAVYTIYKIFTHSSFALKLTSFLKARIVKKELVKRISFEEVTIATGGYGVSKIEVCKDSPVLNKTLLDSNLKKSDILVLAVERGKDIIPNPSANTKLIAGDILVCFGKLGNIRKKLCDIAR